MSRHWAEAPKSNNNLTLADVALKTALCNGVSLFKFRKSK
uniref:Uncharacterized protein n=1 Tax=Romanomermis culicivorax TaxID=13658 RepID=A0A915KJY8_ROMCU